MAHPPVFENTASLGPLELCVGTQCGTERVTFRMPLPGAGVVRREGHRRQRNSTVRVKIITGSLVTIRHENITYPKKNIFELFSDALDIAECL